MGAGRGAEGGGKSRGEMRGTVVLVTSVLFPEKVQGPEHFFRHL